MKINVSIKKTDFRENDLETSHCLLDMGGSDDVENVFLIAQVQRTKHLKHHFLKCQVSMEHFLTESFEILYKIKTKLLINASEITCFSS